MTRDARYGPAWPARVGLRAGGLFRALAHLTHDGVAFLTLTLGMVVVGSCLRTGVHTFIAGLLLAALLLFGLAVFGLVLIAAGRGLLVVALLTFQFLSIVFFQVKVLDEAA